jgi:hypothetical protein
MHHAQVRTYAKPGRATSAVWGEHTFDQAPRFVEVLVALVPASLILATATALLVVLI